MDAGLARPLIAAPAIVVTSPSVAENELSFAEEEVADSPPPTPRVNGFGVDVSTGSVECRSTATAAAAAAAPKPLPHDDDVVEEVEIHDTPRSNLPGRVVYARPPSHLAKDGDRRLTGAAVTSHRAAAVPQSTAADAATTSASRREQCDESVSAEALYHKFGDASERGGTASEEFRLQLDGPRNQMDAHGRVGVSGNDGQTQTTDSFRQSYSTPAWNNDPNPSYSYEDEGQFASVRPHDQQHAGFNGRYGPSKDDPHIAAILRDASMSQNMDSGVGQYHSVRSPSPSKPRLTHYSSADEILQRFSEKWKKYQETTFADNEEMKRSSEPPPPEGEMPAATKRRTTPSSTKLKRPSELEQLRQENSKLKKKLSETEEYFNDKVSALSAALEEGKKLWEKASKENVELRARAEVDELKIQRMEDRIRLLESAMRQPPGWDDQVDGGLDKSSLNDQSLRRVVETQDKELQVLKKEIEVYRYRQQLGHPTTLPTHSSPYSPPNFDQDRSPTQDVWGTNLEFQIPRDERIGAVTGPSPTNAYTRMPVYTMGGIVCEEKLPKQYRSTGDLRASPAPVTHSGTLPRSSASHDRYESDIRPSSGGPKHTSSSQYNLSNKIYWVDDPPPEPVRRPQTYPEPTFEPPKVHPMIVKMATKRKRNERSKTIGLGELRRSQSNDRQPKGTAQSDQRSKPAWLQRVLNLRKGSPPHADAEDRERGGGRGGGGVVDSKPPTPGDRSRSRYTDYLHSNSPRPQPKVNVYCLGRRIHRNSTGSDGVEADFVDAHGPEFDARPSSSTSDGRRHQEPPPPGGHEDRPPTSVLIESIRQRVRDFNLAMAAAGPEPAVAPPHAHHGPPDGRRSAEIPKEHRREESPQRPLRPASSMELGHHARPRVDYCQPHADPGARAGEEEYRVQHMLDRQATRKATAPGPGGYPSPAEEQPLRPPAHGPVRAVHDWGANGNEEAAPAAVDRWDGPKEETRVPPLDLSKLKPEKIAQGTGLPSDMRNYADELIKKYMSSLSANPE